MQLLSSSVHRITSNVITPSKREAATQPKNYNKRLSIRSLLQPHWGKLAVGFIAIAGESVANLLQPWPLKIVLDDVLRSKGTHGWAMAIVYRLVGTDKMAILEFACLAVLAIAAGLLILLRR